jgi:hypothetical protein
MILKIDFDKITDQNDVNKMYSDFEEAFIQTVDKHLLVSMTSFKLGDAPFVKHVGSTTIFVRSNISDFEEAFIQTVDKHAPVKQRKPCQNPAPFINTFVGNKRLDSRPKIL